MLREKNFKKIIISQLIIMIIFIIISIIVSNLYYRKYTELIIENNSYVISNLIEQNPELETEIINSLVTSKGDYKKGYKILKKYGLDDINNYEYINIYSNLKNKTIFISITPVLLMGISFIIIDLIYSKKRNKELNKVNDYLNSIINGNYDLNISNYDEDTISRLKNDIFKITTLLKESKDYSINQKKYLEEVLLDISHQLKTPLTSMYVINDILKNDNIEDSKKKEMLHKNKLQLERIEWLVTSILKLSRLESGTVELKQAQVNVEDIIKKAIEPLKIPIELKEQQIDLNIENTIVTVDENWTVEALVNIIKNAHEHTSLGGKITIDCYDNPIYTEIKITDNGEGISQEELPHIFERFYKGKNNKESIGIGLNMAKTIINRQNGRISVKSKKNKGTTFIIKFYKNVL